MGSGPRKPHYAGTEWFPWHPGGADCWKGVNRSQGSVGDTWVSTQPATSAWREAASWPLALRGMWGIFTVERSRFTNMPLRHLHAFLWGFFYILHTDLRLRFYLLLVFWKAFSDEAVSQWVGAAETYIYGSSQCLWLAAFYLLNLNLWPSGGSRNKYFHFVEQQTFSSVLVSTTCSCGKYVSL